LFANLWRDNAGRANRCARNNQACMLGNRISDDRRIRAQRMSRHGFQHLFSPVGSHKDQYFRSMAA